MGSNLAPLDIFGIITGIWAFDLISSLNLKEPVPCCIFYKSEAYLGRSALLSEIQDCDCWEPDCSIFMGIQ
ncbi:Oidioi.mRNA.OKI2018_I69.chr1.g3028.t2.cds [Oikopleura dioica]|uniref:Oidioi.mRNA.OKI2018_I69.chr1.g3028.t2.cds n=1 Tax=Oikopleura dioica TaxID=34765 RepID=A0ABN7SSW5_OIKDI|nr:Oidioi.mRNA.OKI2018_I69.chr1.g3028.t2.cds [Oikopleura dioica]